MKRDLKVTLRLDQPGETFTIPHARTPEVEVVVEEVEWIVGDKQVKARGWCTQSWSTRKVWHFRFVPVADLPPEIRLHLLTGDVER